MSDINTLSELGTAVSGDALLGVNTGETAGSRASRVLFNGTATTTLSGAGTWVSLIQTAADLPVADTAENFEASTKNVETILAEVAVKFGDYALTDSLATYITPLNLTFTGDISMASANSFTMGILTFTDTNLSPTSVGQFRYDNTITGLEEGGFVYHNGTELRYLLDFATLPTVDGSVPRYNATSDKWVPTAPITGSTAMGTTAVASGSSRVVTDTATGATSTDIVTASGNADPLSLTGYAPSTDGGLFIEAWASTDQVNFRIYNNTTDSITPSERTINWRIEQ